jgi:hypothetical protein
MSLANPLEPGFDSPRLHFTTAWEDDMLPIAALVSLLLLLVTLPTLATVVTYWLMDDDRYK